VDQCQRSIRNRDRMLAGDKSPSHSASAPSASVDLQSFGVSSINQADYPIS